MTRTRLTTALIAGLATVVFAAPAHAAPPSVTIDPVGDWHPGAADISGTARCDNSGLPGGDRGRLSVYVRDPATNLTRAYGTGFAVCDGVPHAWAVTAAGSTVQPGPVKVQVILNTQTGSTSATGMVTLV